MNARSFDGNVPCQQRRVGHDDMVAQAAVVPDVGVGHQKIMVAENRGRAFLHGSMERGLFADRVATAEHEQSWMLRLVNMLRQSTQHGAFANLVVGAEPCAILDDDMAGNLAAVANDDIRFDHRQRPDDDILADLGFRAHDSRGMDIHRRKPRTEAAATRLSSGTMHPAIGR